MAEYEASQARITATAEWGEKSIQVREAVLAYFDATYRTAVVGRVDLGERHLWSLDLYEREKPIFQKLVERVIALEKEVRDLRSRQLDVVLADSVPFSLPEGFSQADLEACKREILQEFETTPGMYPSDFASKYGRDLRLVLFAFSELQKTGEIELTTPEM